MLDLKGGCVVQGVAGERAAYRPVRSLLAAGASPVAIASAVRDHLGGLHEFYVADLDAIEGSRPAWDIYHELEELGLKLWIDAGLRSPRDAREFARRAAEQLQPAAVIAGLESLPDFALLADLKAWMAPTAVVFSLDLVRGLPRTVMVGRHGDSPEAFFQESLRCGVDRVIVLDLAGVGTQRGPTTGPVCHRLREIAPRAQLISGGGVRSAADVRQLLDVGCDRVLVSTAIHNGSLRREDLEDLNRS